MKAYTIGNYEHTILNNGPVKKVGRQPDYDGGIVFATLEEAVAYRDANYPTYSVWSLNLRPGSWEDLTHHLEDETFRRLVHDEDITGLVVPGKPA